MTKADLVKAVAENSGLTQKQVGQVVDATLDAVKSALAAGDEVRLAGFGTFSPRKRPARNGRNPRTGKEIVISARVVPAFKAGKSLKMAASGRA